MTEWQIGYHSLRRQRRNVARKRIVGTSWNLGGRRAALQVRVNPCHGPDLHEQLRVLREYAAAREWRIVDEYIDHRGSGAKRSWPSFNRLRQDAPRGKFDIVLTLRLDRFGRSLRHLINSLGDLSYLGIDFVSVGDTLSLTHSSSDFAIPVAALAEFENSCAQERVKEGLRKAGRRGRRGGRRQVSVDESAVVAMRESGTSWRAISKHMGIGVGTAVRIVGRRSKNPSA
jgi:DNA invertase Pin-like site-specific DNA recombinase